MCYKNNPSLKENHDPVKVIREALSRALLYYYPLAGRLREGPNIKLRVTHLTCGGFILALRLNHTMCDAPGLHLFLNAIAEMARGEHAPSILPVWERELLFT
ncbi:hypothetical protein ACFX13_038161 [Malus domestica]